MGVKSVCSFPFRTLLPLLSNADIINIIAYANIILKQDINSTLETRYKDVIDVIMQVLNLKRGK